MIKLQNFAAERGVTDRQVQRLLKKYEAELEGLVDRRGQNGTWLTDEACDFLRGKMKSNPVVVGDGQMLREKQQLEAEIEELRSMLDAAKDKIIDLTEEKVEYVKQIAEADANKLLLEERNAAAQREAEMQRQRAEAAEAEIDSLQYIAFGLYRKKK